MCAQWSSGGWYYKQACETVGPVSAEQLQELLAAGRLQPRQAVWKKGNQSLLFVHATTAAFGTTGYQSSASEPVPA
jgi:hypothetical protein